MNTDDEGLTWGGSRTKLHYLVVNSLIQVLDEDITLTRFAESWIALRPHDAAAKGMTT